MQGRAAPLELHTQYAIFFKVRESFSSRRNRLERIPPCGFIKPSGRVAQLAEHSALNRQVVGSIPTASTNPFNLEAAPIAGIIHFLLIERNGLVC
jgi:hypothetical protein